MTAILACLDYITDFDKIRQIAGNFGGVAHRLELVRMLDGVKYYNSSIDSTPTRTAAALSALREDPIVICGGQDKGVSFLPLAEVLCSRASAVILTGQCREKILSAFEEYEGYDRDKLPIFICPDFEDAVKKAREIAKEGDTVLLSPACTSFDAFKNFEERGTKFKEIVKSF
jgi:UDP-N-acetylmuramoylalanine--D-glutamate ligase